MSLSTGLLLLVTLLLFTCFIASCNNFFTEDIELGILSTEETTTDGDGGTDAPRDDDGDGISNEVEERFDIETRVADTDQDGFDDGLEFVGENGDPLNGSLSPISGTRSKVIEREDAALNDPDSDQDGLGDTFEIDNSLDETNADTDGDGYSDGLELVARSDPFDSEDRPVRDDPPASDGVTRTGSAPRDSDSDGLADTIEDVNGTESGSRDSDGDGFSDGIEFLMGSDATNFLNVPNFSVPDPPEIL